MSHEPSFGELLKKQRSIYLDDCKEDGGTAQGFREYIAVKHQEDPLLFDKWAAEALMEAATKAWQSPPKKRGDDLFSINGIFVPEHLTRPAELYVNGEEIELNKEESFQKVSCQFATIHDAFEDALIKSRKAHQASAAAEEKMKMVDEARRRAKGDMSKFLRDVADAQEQSVAA
jgi:hypothetical protein